MKNRLSDILRKWAQGALEILLFFPVVFAAGILLLPDFYVWFWMGSLLVFYLMGILEGYCIRKGKKLLCVLAGLFISGVAAYAFAGANSKVIVIFVIYLFALYRGILYAKVPADKAFPEIAYWYALSIYFISYFVFNLVHELEPYAPLISWMGVISVAVYMFHANTLLIKSMANSTNKESISVSVIRHNRITIALVFAIIFVLSSISMLKSALLWVVGSLLKLPGGLQSLTNGQSSGVVMELGAVELPDPSPGVHFPEIFNIIVIALICIAVVMLCALLLVSVKKLIGSVLRGWHRKKRDMGFVDEEESLMTFGSIKDSFIKKVNKRVSKLFKKEPDWESLKGNKERVRYIYRRLLLSAMASGYLFKDYLTPTESIRDIDAWRTQEHYEVSGIGELYSRARYGDVDIEDGDVRKVKDTLHSDKLINKQKLFKVRKK